MNTEKAIREAIRDHFSVVSDTDAAITEEALRKEPAQTMFGKPYGFYRCRRYAAVNRTR